MAPLNWETSSGGLHQYIESETEKTLEAYRNQPVLVREHANLEEDIVRGGYAGRQLQELIQNGADALWKSKGGRIIEVCLKGKYAYCADNGAPIDQDGAQALMFSHVSPKRGTSEIGRFGLGFKSVLGLTDAPEFFSRSGSFRFSRKEAESRIKSVVSNAEMCPVLRIAIPVDYRGAFKKDRTLRRLGKWASNIVRLPLNEDRFLQLERQVRDFPAEFLLFVDHVGRVTLRNMVNSEERTIVLTRNGRCREFTEGNGKAKSHWMLFKRVHTLSGDAGADRRATDDLSDVPIQWAAPLERLDRPGYFWAFFPTMTSSLVAGILNAPWKTNEDRQNLLSGPYNEELISAAAGLIVESLPELTTPKDPGGHLDVLPRRKESGDSEQSGLLRDRLFESLQDCEIVPDQDGVLRRSEELRYPPKEFIRGSKTIWEPLNRWASMPNRPRDWLHHSAMTSFRLATIGQFHPHAYTRGVPAATQSEWLESLVGEGSTQCSLTASMGAIQTAAAIPREVRNVRKDNSDLGRIVLMGDFTWRTADPESVVLPEADSINESEAASTVHPGLAADKETRDALRTLGIKPASPESRLRRMIGEMLDSTEDTGSEERLTAFWELTRSVKHDVAASIIQDALKKRCWVDDSVLQQKIKVRVRSGAWKPVWAALSPGAIVPGEIGRDNSVTVDSEFHHRDVNVLRNIFPPGVTSGPSKRDLSGEPWFDDLVHRSREEFCRRPLRRRPHRHLLKFKSNLGSGPLEVLKFLSDEGRAHYTQSLLALDETFESWTMIHSTQGDIYLPFKIPAPAIKMISNFGCIRTPKGVVPFGSALGEQPENPAALQVLLQLPNAERIREAFGLAELTSGNVGEPIVIDEDEPSPLLDEWPGLRDYLPEERRHDRLVRCEKIIAGNMEWPCYPYGSRVYLARAVAIEEENALKEISKALELGLSWHDICRIVCRTTPAEVQSRQEEVRRQTTESARLLKAVGEDALRAKLPESLIAILEEHEGELTGLRVAEAAIATWHSDTLRQFREHLNHLEAPSRWAGSAQAVRFVSALGFPEEWAGTRNKRRSPFVEVDGPFTLPSLHPYQAEIVRNVRAMLRADDLVQRRGMISMPTGSGKTRVAVQAVVDALREGELVGGVLWVADRDELCEQAVEAWKQVWASKGALRERLRISRLWQGQPAPLPTSENHVVVASVQTLAARFERHPEHFEFLADFALVVFDEAHRSIAPSYTGVMQELGMGGRRRQMGEPFLIGLTATPYRGHNEHETAWLARRYGEKRLDAGAFSSDDPHEVVAELQEMEVLARADQAEIDGGELSLSDDELRQMAGVPWLPQSAEGRIARDSKRTMRIIEEFEMRIEADWPTLIFATSVEHSQVLAALLSGRGVKARAVSGATESSARRRIVDEFRGGEIQALVNYGVFREGFDAPRTRAIIVARPVYSPNLYFQMIGRGLRGVLNGGNNCCLILNVRDNIVNFEGKLAFSDLDWLWG